MLVAYTNFDMAGDIDFLHWGTLLLLQGEFHGNLSCKSVMHYP